MILAESICRLDRRMMAIDRMLEILGILHVLLEDELRETSRDSGTPPDWLERFKMQFIQLDYMKEPSYHMNMRRTLQIISEWSDKLNSACSLEVSSNRMRAKQNRS